jgi:t-SNARE complex subunit (syntaxin)
MPCLLTDLRKVQLSARDHFQRIFNDHEKIKLQLESQKKELEMRGIELEKRDAQSESERRMLAEEIEKVSLFGLDCCHNFSNIS